jgi:hypothetical protein
MLPAFVMPTYVLQAKAEAVRAALLSMAPLQAKTGRPSAVIAAAIQRPASAGVFHSSPPMPGSAGESGK